MVKVFGAPTSRVHVVNNGVESVFLNSNALPRGPWLVCTAAIIEMKQVLKLAEITVRAKTKLWVIGKAHSDTHEYAKRFVAFARQNAGFIRYEGEITDRQRLAEV